MRNLKFLLLLSFITTQTFASSAPRNPNLSSMASPVAITGKTSKEVWLKFTGQNHCEKGFCAEKVPVKPLEIALNFYKKNSRIINNNEFMAIADFSIHSTKPRLFVLNLRTGQVESMHVTHGKNSETELGVAGKFSNVVGSEMSSLGFYLTEGELYVGKHGNSLRLDGLSKSNSNARERYIVIHGADYATQWFAENKGRLGLSQGCPAVSPSKINGLIEKLKGQGILYIHKDTK